MNQTDLRFQRWKEADRTERNRFVYYLNNKGLTEQESVRGENLILLLQEKFRINWRPGNCRCIYLDTADANKLLQSHPYLSETFGEIKDKRLFHTHFFWASNIREKPFILDPTGVPMDLSNPLVDIVPYFGLLESSPETHRWAYQDMTDLDSWGTRELPLGFHP